MTLRPLDYILASRMRDFVDWAAEDTEGKVQLRSLLDAYVFKCNNRLAIHGDGRTKYFKREKRLPGGWEWAEEPTRDKDI